MDRLCNLGKKVCVAGAVLVSLPVAVPIMVPSLFVLSVVGVALAIPVGSAAVAFVVVKGVLGLGKQTAGYISAPPAGSYENKGEIPAEDLGKHGVESDKDFAGCDGATESLAPEIEEEALAPASQLYKPKKISVSEIIEEEPVKHGDGDFRKDGRASEIVKAEPEALPSPTQLYGNKKVGGVSLGGSRSDEVVEQDSENPGGDRNKSFAAAGVTAESEHVKSEPEDLTSPTQVYETKQVSGPHPYSHDIVENDSVIHSDESSKDNAGLDGETESKEAAQATDSTEILRAIVSQGDHQGSAKNPDFDDGLRAAENCNVETMEVSHVSEESIGDHAAEAENPDFDDGLKAAENCDVEALEVSHTGDQQEAKNTDFGDGLRAAENCDVEASPELDGESSPKLRTENCLEQLANNPESVPESVVQVPDVGEISVEEAPEKCWETAHNAVEQVYVEDFEDGDSPRVPCKSAPDFYDYVDAKEIGGVHAVTKGNENFEEAKDVDLPPRVVEASPKLLNPHAVTEPVEHVADVSVELAPEMCWEIASKAVEPETICVEVSEDLKHALPCKSPPDFYERMDVNELDHGADDATTVNKIAQQTSKPKEGNAEETVEDEVASVSLTIGVEREGEASLNRVESNGCLEDSAVSPIPSEGEEHIHFENAGGSTDGQEHRKDSIDEPGSLAEGHQDEIALGSDEEAFRGVASEDDQSRSCGLKSEVASLLKPSVSMIPV